MRTYLFDEMQRVCIMSDAPGRSPAADADVFDIPWRPERIAYDEYSFFNDAGELVTAGGGSAIEGYTRFDLFCNEYDRDDACAVIETADDWGPYVTSEWEQYNQLLYDLDEDSSFEVRVLPDRVAIDVMPNTTSESIKSFVEQFIEEVSGDWRVERDSERISA